jgi:hypothetical protein
VRFIRVDHPGAAAVVLLVCDVDRVRLRVRSCDKRRRASRLQRRRIGLSLKALLAGSVG